MKIIALICLGIITFLIALVMHILQKEAAAENKKTESIMQAFSILFYSIVIIPTVYIIYH